MLFSSIFAIVRAALCLAAAKGELGRRQAPKRFQYAHTITMADGNYPNPTNGAKIISGLDQVAVCDALVFHAGTKRDGDGITTGGAGRVLYPTGTGSTPQEAEDRAHAALAKINFAGAQHRTDIRQGSGSGSH